MICSDLLVRDWIDPDPLPDLEILILLCHCVRLWCQCCHCCGKRRQLPPGSNLAPSTETLVIACCFSNKSVETPYKSRTNLRSYPTHSAVYEQAEPGIPEVRVVTNSATVCRMILQTVPLCARWSYRQCHCVQADTNCWQDVSQEECLTLGWNYDWLWKSAPWKWWSTMGCTFNQLPFARNFYSYITYIFNLRTDKTHLKKQMILWVRSICVTKIETIKMDPSGVRYCFGLVFVRVRMWYIRCLLSGGRCSSFLLWLRMG